MKDVQYNGKDDVDDNNTNSENEYEYEEDEGYRDAEISDEDVRIVNG